MKKIINTIIIFLSLILLFSCDKSTYPNGKAFITLDINPSIEIVIENGKVTNLYAVNDDAKILIFNEKLVGKEINDVINEVIELSVECKYLTKENNIINYTVSSDNKNLEVSLESSIEKIVASTKVGFDVLVSKLGLFTDIIKLNELKEKLSNNDKIQELRINKFKMIASAIEANDNLTYEVAVQLNINELIEYIKENRDSYYNYAYSLYQDSILQGELAFESILKSVEYSTYTSFFSIKTVEYPINYGALYSLYGSCADSLDQIISAKELVNNYKDKTISNINDINEILNNYGVDVSKEGDITLNSLCSYLDNVIIDNKDLDILIEKINLIESDLKEKYEKEIDGISNEIDDIKNSLTEFKSRLVALQLLSSSSMKEIFDIYIIELDTLISLVSSVLNDGIYLDELKELSTVLKEKKNAMLENINTMLSSEELVELEEIYNKSKNIIEDAQKTLNDVVVNAKNKAYDFLLNKKNNRIK